MLAQSIQELNLSYFLIDIFSQLTHRKFNKDLDQIISRSKQSGIQKIIIRSTNEENSRESLRLCRLYPETLFCSSGMSPHESKQWTQDSELNIKQLLLNQECVALGEIGLDFDRNFSQPSTQLQVFESMLRLAKQVNKPAIVVVRNAHDQALDLIGRYASDVPYIVIHSFCGSQEQCLRYLSSAPNVFIGLSGILCKDKCDVTPLLANQSLPLNRIMLESDSPWNLPNIRSSRFSDDVKRCLTDRSLGYLNRYCTYQRNEPCSLPVLTELIAAISGQTAHEVALQTTYNALKVFGLQ